jgi:dimethylargininase
MFTRAIVRPPAPNFAEGLTTANLGAPDYERALKQHEDYCRALERCGLTLIRLKADPQYPDSTFVEDAAVLVGALPCGRANAPASANRSCAVLTRPGAPSRKGEVESMREVLADFFRSLLSIASPGTVDGGDVCEAGNHFFIGISERTNESGARQLAKSLAPLGYTTCFVDIANGGTDVRGPRRGSPAGVLEPPATHAQDARATHDILHLKSGLSYLGDSRLAVIEALADRPEFRGYDLLRVNDDEMYAANCIRVNDHLLVALGFPVLERNLRALGYQTIALEMSEFQKMDGGLSCLSLRF